MEQKTNQWILDVQEDPATEELFLQFPPDMLEVTGWQEGDVLEWHDNKDGSWTLKKKQ
jgi:hypothetical protein